MTSTSKFLKGEELEGIEDDMVPHHHELRLWNLIEPIGHHLYHRSKVPKRMKVKDCTYFLPRGWSLWLSFVLLRAANSNSGGAIMY